MGLHIRRSVKVLHQWGKEKSNDFKYDYPTLTNTDAFCNKISHRTNYVGGNYQVGDNIDVVGSGPLARRSDNSTSLHMGHLV